MDARFLADRWMVLPSRPLFFLVGDVTDGVVRPGMLADAPGRAFRQPVEAIEFMDERRGWTALGFRYTDVAHLRQWTELEWNGMELHVPGDPLLHPCPCCDCRTLSESERGSYEICIVCGWEDDGVQFGDPDYRGGANEESLNQARAAFAARINPCRHVLHD